MRDNYANGYVEKLSAMLATSEVRSLTVVHMEVPCCTGLLRIAEAAVQRSGRNVPLKNMIVSIRGRFIGPESLPVRQSHPTRGSRALGPVVAAIVTTLALLWARTWPPRWSVPG